MMILGYNTNGMPFHRLHDSVRLIAEAGMGSVALTLDHHHLDPTDRNACLREARKLRPLLDHLGLRVTIETGARYLLDPRRKHQPTLVSARPEDRARRRTFLESCILVGAELAADSVSLWSGSADDAPDEEVAFERLAQEMRTLAGFAAGLGQRLAFEPEPGMVVDTLARFERLIEEVHDPRLGLTLDVNHVVALRDGAVEEQVQRWRERLWNVHLSDGRAGVHEHLVPGDGEVNFAALREALVSVAYSGPVHLELSRHGHDAVDVMHRACRRLRACGFPFRS